MFTEKKSNCLKFTHLVYHIFLLFIFYIVFLLKISLILNSKQEKKNHFFSMVIKHFPTHLEHCNKISQFIRIKDDVYLNNFEDA